MVERATAASPRVLRWARERAGFTVEEVAERTRRSPDELEAWEAGLQHPTFRQLERLATLYRRPVAVFFFPEPPRERDIRSEFRTLPASQLEKLAPDTRFAIREARAYQQSLRELTGGGNPAERLITRDIRASPKRSVTALADRVRDHLGVTLETQKSWPKAEAAFRGWRGALEGAGVFVFKRPFKQREVSAFCLHDDEFPLIMINNGTSFTRQIFSLFHELAHLLYRVGGITTEDQSYIDDLGGTDRTIEIACNRFAAEFLVPRRGFPLESFRGNVELEQTVSDIARAYNVSREVILRRLLEEDIIRESMYTKLAAAWNEDYRRNASGEGGGDYYLTRAAYLGDAYLDLAFSRYHAGRIDLTDLAEHLHVKARNVETLESYFRRRK